MPQGVRSSIGRTLGVRAASTANTCGRVICSWCRASWSICCGPCVAGRSVRCAATPRQPQTAGPTCWVCCPASPQVSGAAHPVAETPESAAAEQRVAIVMLTVDQRETTLRALRSFGETLAHWDVLVWDNGSIDGTLEAVAREFPIVITHHHPTNLGVASGRNAAARLAIERFAPAYLLFLDNDMVVQPGFVEALRAPFLANPQLGQTQAKLLYLDDPQRINDGGGCRINFRSEERRVGEGW